MAAHSPVGFDVERLRDLVRDTYTRVAERPDDAFHFHRGGAYAVDYLGYDAAALAALPREVTRRFAGVGNPHAAGALRRGDVVLDHACGAGTDLLLAARQVGPGGRAIGVDMTPAMRAVAETGAREAGLAERVEVRAGFLEELPVESHSVDVVISNGVLNLSPDKPRVLAEIARVLKPGGRLQLADVVVQRELKLEARVQPELWAACVGGALPEPELFELLAWAGFVDAAIVGRHDCFANTMAEAKVARDLHVGGVTLVAQRPSLAAGARRADG